MTAKPILAVYLQNEFMDDEEKEDFAKSFAQIKKEYHVIIFEPIDQEEEVRLEILSPYFMTREETEKLMNVISQATNGG